MKALIVYGTRNGGTAGLAHMIATSFEREGWQADVRDAADAPGIGDVDVVDDGAAADIVPERHDRMLALDFARAARRVVAIDHPE